MCRNQWSLAVLVALAAGPAFAADATLTFTGTFLQPSCQVDSSTASQTVNLGTAQIANFSSVGSTGNPTAFSLNLLNCSPGTNVAMTVAGTATTVTSVLANTGGSATQIGVQILQATSLRATTGTPINLNSAVGLGQVNSTNSMTIPLVAQFYRLGTLTAGTVTATATVSFTYN